MGAGEEAMEWSGEGKFVMGECNVVMGSGFMKNLWGLVISTIPPLLPLPLPDDSDLGRRKGSKSMPEVEEGIVCIGGPGVLGVEEDLPLLPPMPPLPFARLCFLYLTLYMLYTAPEFLPPGIRSSRTAASTIPC